MLTTCLFSYFGFFEITKIAKWRRGLGTCTYTFNLFSRLNFSVCFRNDTIFVFTSPSLRVTRVQPPFSSLSIYFRHSHPFHVLQLFSCHSLKPQSNSFRSYTSLLFFHIHVLNYVNCLSLVSILKYSPANSVYYILLRI